MHKKNCFVTLTFSDEHLPNPPTLDVRDFQLFMKRLRKKFGSGIRFFHCGEYGSKYGRPHYHACLFNFDFPDKKLWRVSEGNNLYTSEILQELWEHKGYCIIGEVTFQSAAYVARYIMKKINGKDAADHYEIYDLETGELSQAKPEYVTMSRRPGIAAGWFEKYQSDVFPHDYVIVRGHKCKPPRYYDNILKNSLPFDFEEIKFERYTRAQQKIDNSTKERLAVREEVQNARLKQLVRPLE